MTLTILFVFFAIFLFLNRRGSLLDRIPGPRTFAFSRWRLALEDWKGTRTRKIYQLHQKYGPVVRIGPNEVSFNSPLALRTIYGAGSGFERTPFYRMFDVYGQQNLFTFHSVKEHAERKKLLAHAYSKSVMLNGPVAVMVEEKVKQYLDLLEREPDGISEIFSTLHYFSLDIITEFLYGRSGATSAMMGNKAHRALLNDILDPARKRLSWFAVHLPMFTKWLYTRSGAVEIVLRPFLPMQKPTTYTGIRQHALDAFHIFKSSQTKQNAERSSYQTIIERLWAHHQSQKPGGLKDMEIASECADHLLAGIDTTSDTLMFLIWALSLPQNVKFQETLNEEVSCLTELSLNSGIPNADSCAKLRYLDAIIKETLRLYAPLPASEPRSSPIPSTIDTFEIPAGACVSMSPYALHRNPDVFNDPLAFNPDRWLETSPEKLNEMKKWWWAFSSGGRMCIGIHLAMVEMTILAAAVYKKYRTSIAPSFVNATPGITSRFEVFYDEMFPNMAEHVCYIEFRKR
ncbi:putative P450 monooxygenase [Lepidopterella palustris CBS 459.81]|uniref:Putative P450 monooxygenase n=1 Tax=Lepidopterella palustris CBS 459.81 TaxID=1314670 RepID=A0A8E2E6A6_9PEZI|nr:putative P450 monooxygenase [Lepidopterella palustris CBS 459.81]